MAGSGATAAKKRVITNTIATNYNGYTLGKLGKDGKYQLLNSETNIIGYAEEHNGIVTVRLNDSSGLASNTTVYKPDGKKHVFDYNYNRRTITHETFDGDSSIDIGIRRMTA